AARERLERARESWTAGRDELAMGNHAEALKLLLAAQRVTELALTKPALHNDLGKAFLGVGKEEQALGAWNNARKLSPTFHAPYLHLGSWYRSKGLPEQAFQHYRAGLAFHPTPVPPDLPGLVAELEKGMAEKRVEKRAELVRRIEANPADANALADRILLELRTVDCPEDAPPVDGIRQAVLAVGKGHADLDGLLARQQSAVGDRPGSVVDRAGLGTVHLLRGEFERARAVFGEALALSETDAMGILGASITDLLCGAEKETRMETAARVLSRRPLPWIVLGAGCIAHSKPDPARRALLNALFLDPANPEVSRLFAATCTTPENREMRDAFLRAHRRLLE
ncbi:MAG: tetratricopeptide repeat protein, partial [Planctomycetota bacterium]